MPKLFHVESTSWLCSGTGTSALYESVWLTAPVPSGLAVVVRRYVTAPPMVRIGDWDTAARSGALPDDVLPTVSRLADDSIVVSG